MVGVSHFFCCYDNKATGSPGKLVLGKLTDLSLQVDDYLGAVFWAAMFQDMLHHIIAILVLENKESGLASGYSTEYG